MKTGLFLLRKSLLFDSHPTTICSGWRYAGMRYEMGKFCLGYTDDRVCHYAKKVFSKALEKWVSVMKNDCTWRHVPRTLCYLFDTTCPWAPSSYNFARWEIVSNFFQCLIIRVFFLVWRVRYIITQRAILYTTVPDLLTTKVHSLLPSICSCLLQRL